MRILSEQDVTENLTTDVLIYTARNLNADLVLELVKRSTAKISIGRLLEAAAANYDHGGNLVKLLLIRAKISEFTEAALIPALGNNGSGMEVIHALEGFYGRIVITESLLAKCIHKTSANTIGFLLSRVGSAQITEDAFIRAIRYDGVDQEGFQSAVAEKSLHLPITTEILVSAAQYGTPRLFRFLWNRCSRSSVPEALINAAARNTRPSFSEVTLFKFLLREAEAIEIGEETVLAITSNIQNDYTFFDLLLERGLQADTTETVPETLLINGGIKVKCLTPTRLEISKGMKVTEEVFRVTASRVSDEFLRKLTNICGLERIPNNWLDTSRLYIAVRGHFDTTSHDKISAILKRGVKPNVASPNG